MMPLNPKHVFKKHGWLVVESFLRMTQTLEKVRNFKFFHIFEQYFIQILNFVALNGFKKLNEHYSRYPQ